VNIHDHLSPSEESISHEFARTQSNGSVSHICRRCFRRWVLVGELSGVNRVGGGVSSIVVRLMRSSDSVRLYGAALP
jgi:hypothetical protein